MPYISPKRFLTLAVTTCALGALFSGHVSVAQTGATGAISPTGAGPTIEPDSSGIDESPRSLLEALAEWSGEATALEFLVVQNHPEVADAYVREVESSVGDLTHYFYQNHYKTTDAFYVVTGYEASTNSREFFDFATTDRPAFADWQAHLAQAGGTATGADLTLADFVAGRYPSILAELDRVNLSPAASGVTLIDFLTEKGYDHLYESAHSMIDKIIPAGSPPGSCACDVVVDFVTNPVSWSQVKDEDYYDGAPLPVVDTRYSVVADGPAQDAVFQRRTKAKDFELQRKDYNRQAILSARLHCLKTGNNAGAYCQTGSCSADLIARTRYSSRVSTFVDAGAGKAKIAAYNGARLLYQPGQPSEKTLISHGVGVSGEKNTEWDIGGFAGPLITLVAEIVVGVFTGFGGFSPETITNVADGIVNLHHVEGADGSYASAMSLDKDVDGTMAPNVTYTLQLDTESIFYGWGRLHAHTKTYAGVNSSFLMAAATDNFVCDAHVIPPQRTVWWRYGAAPYAPEGQNFLQDQVRELALLRLNAALPNNAFAGDTEISGEGVFQP